MKVTFAKSDDALYFRLQSQRIVDSEEVRPGVILDYDDKNQVVGIEFLHVSERAAQDELTVMQFEQC